MAQKSTSHDNTQQKAKQPQQQQELEQEQPPPQQQRQGGGLPVSIHPDDAKDKVFTAILKALLKMGNKPSSPKELANIIVKHKYATLGGATPFATVSSRISQHFKRAAEHNPPRAPLLAKHVDQNHSRKINYSLATESVSKTADDSSHTAATDDDEERPNPLRTNSKTRRTPFSKAKRSLRSAHKPDEDDNENDEEEEDDDSEEEEERKDAHQQKRLKPNTYLSQESNASLPNLVNSNNDDEEEESEGEQSDYHEEMLKDADEEIDLQLPTGRRLSRRHSKITAKPQNTIDIKKTSPPASPKSTNYPNTSPASSTQSPEANNTTTTTVIDSTSSPSPATVTVTSAPNISNNNITIPASSSSAATPTTILPKPSNKLTVPQDNIPHAPTRKPSFSFSSGFANDQEFWTPFSFEHDFDNVFVHDGSTAHHIPFNIATPESVSVSELDDYFTSTGSTPNRSQRKSFSSAMLGPNDKSLLQKVLLASAARGVADRIEEKSEQETGGRPESIKAIKKEKGERDEKETKQEDALATKTVEQPTESVMSTADKSKSVSVSKLMDVKNSEDFVKFEDDEKKESSPSTAAVSSTAPVPVSEPPSTQTNSITSTNATAAAAPPPASSAANASTTNTGTAAIASSAPSTSNTPPVKKVAEILPATSTTLTAAEILKSMNIQNLNLSALHQMTSNIPSLQHLSPTFDLAKTMAAYMQSLAKSASASNPSSSSSSHSADLKTILARFPALEAFIKKDSPAPASNNTATTTPSTASGLSVLPLAPSTSSVSLVTPSSSIHCVAAGTATPPLLSPTATEHAPHLHNSTSSTATPTPSITAGSTEPIVHTLTPFNPPMYITLVDHIAVCVVVLPKTEHSPEYRIMRRVDSGFINGTVLLTAGGIETESERSMILSFEMERIRMPKKKSPLFGTWIPLRRAQELAVTCSIQHKLGHFLEDSIESFFPSPLPIQINARKPTRDSRLTALALAALRSTSDTTKNNGFVIPPISRQASSSGSMAAATQLQELLLTHPHKALKSNGLINTAREPLLGRFDEPEKTDKLLMTTKPTTTANQQEDKDESDVDVVNSSDSSVASNDEESDTESSSGTIHSATGLDKKKQAKFLQRVKPPPINTNAAALSSASTATTPTTSTATSAAALDLQEILSRVTSKQPLHIHPRDLQKKRRRSVDGKSDKEDIPEPAAKTSKSLHTSSPPLSSTRKKPSNHTNTNTSSKATKPSQVKKQPIANHTSVVKHRSEASNKKKKEEEIDNVVVEHKSLPAIQNSTATQPPIVKQEDEDEDDEDEDIDIGGSDFDDDLR
ncbi:hypothetical protein A0J61_01973 [Choanephora cucurbitarum]|uniref:HTH APSES-type domain-containing protein n=1 Tax=Choanephora cucurbitarum TaxID=101091 RepID=A0A1C7NLT0_9FUNG|nr:hypothetical protein A0J61_01973 [Choanephora cucurbitarum]